MAYGFRIRKAVRQGDCSRAAVFRNRRAVMTAAAYFHKTAGAYCSAAGRGKSRAPSEPIMRGGGADDAHHALEKFVFSAGLFTKVKNQE